MSNQLSKHSTEINGGANLLAKSAAHALEGAARIFCVTDRTHARYGDQSTVALEIIHATRWSVFLAEMAGSAAQAEPHAERAHAAIGQFNRSASASERGNLLGIALAAAALAAGCAEDRALIAGEPIAADAAAAAATALDAAARLLDIDKIVADCRAAAAKAMDAAQKDGARR
jgi:hypothetical protein